jgi:uncharacterized protein
MHIGIGDIRKSKGLAKAFQWDSQVRLPGVSLEGPLVLDLKVTNAGSRVMVAGPLRAQVKLLCSRCSEEFTFPVKVQLEEEFLPVASEEAQSRANNLLDGPLTFENDKLEMDELLRQEIEAAFPIQALCREDCRGLCARCGANLNQEDCRCQPEEVDSRWQALNQISNSAPKPGKKPKNKK